MPSFEEVELAALRRMTAAEKVHVAEGLWRLAWNLKAAALRSRHPDWPEGRVQDEVRNIFSHDAA